MPGKHHYLVVKDIEDVIAKHRAEVTFTRAESQASYATLNVLFVFSNFFSPFITIFANRIRDFIHSQRESSHYTYLLAIVINNLSDIQILNLTQILCKITGKFDKTFVFHQISQLDYKLYITAGKYL